MIWYAHVLDYFASLQQAGVSDSRPDLDWFSVVVIVVDVVVVVVRSPRG